MGFVQSVDTLTSRGSGPGRGVNTRAHIGLFALGQRTQVCKLTSPIQHFSTEDLKPINRVPKIKLLEIWRFAFLNRTRHGSILANDNHNIMAIYFGVRGHREGANVSECQMGRTYGLTV